MNRLWKRYLGLGLFEPVDDYREAVGASHPELLAWLADDFMRHGYDIKHTVRRIMTSRVYQAKFDDVAADRFDVDQPGAKRWFRSPQLRRLTAEQALDSINVAMEQKLDPAKRVFRRTDSTGLARALGRSAVRNDVSTARADDTAVLTGLELLNGTEFEALLKAGPLRERVEAMAKSDPEGAARMMYVAVLSREPSAAERGVAAKALRDGGPEAIMDVLWAMFVSPEFAYVR